MQGSRFKAALTKLALITVGVVLGLACVEIGLRLVYILPSESATFVELFRHDPLLGWRNKPNVRALWVREEFATRVEMNSKGLRDNEISYHKSAGEYRILALGDSFVQGLQVQHHQIWTERLEQMLNIKLKTRRFQVINAGVSGWGTDQEYLFLKTEGLKYHPDLVFVAFTLNDFNDNYYHPERARHAPKPFFTVKDGHLNLVNVPVSYRKVYQRPFNVGGERLIDRGIGRFEGTKKHLRWSYTYRLTGALIRKRFPRIAKALQDIGLMRKPPQPPPMERRLPDRPDWKMFFERLRGDRDVEEAIAVTEALIDAIRDECQKHGAKVMVLYIPLQHQVYEDSWQHFLRELKVPKGDADPTYPGRLLQKLCERQRIPCLDLTPKFRQQALKSQERLFFQGDGHWTPAGHELAAKVIFAKLIPLLADSRPTR